VEVYRYLDSEGGGIFTRKAGEKESVRVVSRRGGRERGFVGSRDWRKRPRVCTIRERLGQKEGWKKLKPCRKKSATLFSKEKRAIPRGRMSWKSRRISSFSGEKKIHIITLKKAARPDGSKPGEGKGIPIFNYIKTVSFP